MPTNDRRRVDGSRMRCTGCGHPVAEHRLARKCTVPKCACVAYAEPTVTPSKKRSKPA